MINTIARLLLVFMLVIGGYPPLTASTAAAQPAATTVPAVPTEAVAIVDVVDVSGSLAKAIAAMSAAETQQLTTTLKPNDLYARVNFDGTARLAMLMPVREPEDVQRITSVLAQNVAAKGAHTSISEGLIKAREVIERERGARRVVLVLLTDGILSTADPAVEQKRLAEIAAWWAERTWARRIVVGVGDDKSGALAKLAKSLNADIVSLDDYAKRSIVARAITSVRTPAATVPVPAPPAPPASSASQWIWLWVGAGGALVGSMILLRTSRKSKRAATAPALPSLTVAGLPAKPEMQVTARVAASGRALDTVLNLNDLEDGAFTIGAAGDVVVPGLHGLAVRVEVINGSSMVLTVEPGANVRINGESIEALSGPIDVGRQCRLTSGGVAIALRLHQRGVEYRTPVAVTSLRRRVG